ncbi:hypothetical protein [Streptomyces europaeiscabiei]|uniref:hypothetical protein n=1 Tax=Streptomyces europaeiscabiei TaxID=146819 RepID=UPI0029C9DFA6|nr:hypothetical protein [Streptomyces europaeiscabiei]
MTNSDGGKGLDSISVSDSDPNPAALKVGTITVDKPIVTTCHTSARDAVPGDGTDGALLFNRLVDKWDLQP